MKRVAQRCRVVGTPEECSEAIPPECISFTVVGLPQPAGSKRAVRWRAKDGRNGTNVIDTNPKVRPWKREIAAAAVEAHPGPLLEGPLRLEVCFFVPRPVGHMGKRGLRPTAPAYPTVRPDVLKLCRGLEDALTGVLWRDDSQIVDEVLAKRYGEPACTVVCVGTVG